MARGSKNVSENEGVIEGQKDIDNEVDLSLAADAQEGGDKRVRDPQRVQVGMMKRLLESQGVELSRMRQKGSKDWAAGYEFFARINGRVYTVDGFASFANLIISSGIGTEGAGSVADEAQKFLASSARK